jgi:hypothetical protein
MKLRLEHTISFTSAAGWRAGKCSVLCMAFTSDFRHPTSHIGLGPWSETATVTVVA